MAILQYFSPKSKQQDIRTRQLNEKPLGKVLKKHKLASRLLHTACRHAKI